MVLIGLASTDGLYYASGVLDCPGAMFTASHNPARYNGIKVCRPGARAVGQDTGLAAVRERAERYLADGVPRADAPRDARGAGPAARLRRAPARSRRPRRRTPAEGGRRRRQRDGRPHRAGGARPCRRSRTPADRAGAAVLRARRQLPEPRGQPPRAGEPARPAGRGGRARRRRRAGLRRRRRPLLRGGRAGRAGEPERGHRDGGGARGGQGAGGRARAGGDPQPHHVARRAGDGDRGGRHAAAHPRRPLVHQGRDGLQRSRLRRRALRALLLPRVLGSRHRHAGGAARAGGAAGVGRPDLAAGRRVRAVRGQRRDQLPRRGRAGRGRPGPRRRSTAAAPSTVSTGSP